MPSAEHFDVTAEEYYFSINDGAALPEWYSDDEEYSEAGDACYTDPVEDNNVNAEPIDNPVTQWTTINLGGTVYDVSDSGLIKNSGYFHPAGRGMPAHGTPYHYFVWYDIETGEYKREWMHIIVYQAFYPDEVVPEGWEIRHIRSQRSRFYSNALANISIFPRFV